ncbi:hypothetical protein [Mucilaginibacter psychrotolerans]|uniref:DUF3592 domain-containing protein n=1 Tax=Mucilaginibacter psychrotolerans TaxID=1524096 RepID=A0A4Y8SAL2_9SPHI|nr:hypothetical protein [Mucilaginibacter psychrotolerans]TFF35998.1 hypothetical protein E2R66_17425 [Mucilaginibacter psychrotolerans]
MSVFHIILSLLFFILEIAAVIAVVRLVNNWIAKRRTKRDAAAIKVKTMVLDVTATGIHINNERQFDFKVEIPEAQGTSKTVMVTQSFLNGTQPNVGDEITVCINPNDKYDRWIHGEIYTTSTTIFGITINYRKTRWTSNEGVN